jgi:Cyclic nucleotide-binding domain
MRLVRSNFQLTSDLKRYLDVRTQISPLIIRCQVHNDVLISMRSVFAPCTLVSLLVLSRNSEKLTFDLNQDMSNYLAAGDTSEPYITLVRAFSSYGDVDHGRLKSLVPYLERSSVPEGLVLWRQDDDSDGLYLIESGVLRASYRFADHIPPVEESMVPGTLAGELSALTNLPRNATVVVERRAVLWKLSTVNMRRLESDDPILARTFVQFVLKGNCSQTWEELFTNQVFSGENRL